MKKRNEFCYILHIFVSIHLFYKIKTLDSFQINAIYYLFKKTKTAQIRAIQFLYLRCLSDVHPKYWVCGLNNVYCIIFVSMKGYINSVVEPIMKHKLPLKVNQAQCLFLLCKPWLFIDCSQFISIQSPSCDMSNYVI